MEVVRMVFAYACSRKIKFYQMDVKSAFLNGELEEVYIEQPEGFLLSEKEDYVCRLKKALYGLKQAPKAWYSRLDGYIHQKGSKKGTADINLYVQIDKDNLTIVEEYVDDIIFGSNDDRLSKNFATKMQSEFEMCLLGELTYFLGLQISQQERNIYMSSQVHKGNTQEIQNGRLETCPYSDVGQVAKFHATPKESHIIAVRRILQYLKDTTEYGLWYPKDNNLIIQSFTDADWAESIDDCKSTSGATFYLGGCLISWLSKKKTSISLSTAEAEYIAAIACCTEVLWIKQTLQDIQVQFNEPIPIFCDNTNAVSISKNPVMH
eukprot:PITA_20758